MVDFHLIISYNLIRNHNQRSDHMGKRRARWDYKHYLRYLKEGRGQGTGSAYQPFITIHDLPSRGISTRVSGRTTGRIHHLLSRNEQYYFYLLDFDPDVLDIREQFPLRLSETLEIASDLNISHPRHGNFPVPLTTDFLVTRHDGLHARTVKPSSELSNPRTIDKFSIEYAYWCDKGIDWKIVTEKQINKVRARNLRWLYSGQTASELIPDPILREEVLLHMINLFEEMEFSFTHILEIIEGAFPIPCGSGIALLKELILTNRCSVDLDRPIDFMNPIKKEV